MVRARSWAAELRTEGKRAQDEIARLRSKLEAANTLQAITLLISAGSVTTLLGLVLGTDSRELEIVVAIVGTIAAWAPAAAELMRKNLFGNSRVKQLEELVQARAEAGEVAMDLEIWVASPAPRPPFPGEQVERAGALVAQLTAARGA